MTTAQLHVEAPTGREAKKSRGGHIRKRGTDPEVVVALCGKRYAPGVKGVTGTVSELLPFVSCVVCADLFRNGER